MKQVLTSIAILGTFSVQTYGAPSVRVRLPERFRLLTKQLYDFRVEATNLTGDPTAPASRSQWTMAPI